MATFEERFQKACATGDIPGIVLLASDITGLLSFRLLLQKGSANFGMQGNSNMHKHSGKSHPVYH